MAMYVYSTEGEPVGFLHGTSIHDMEGWPLGRIVGSRVHRFDGSYVGEWFKEMVVERPDVRPLQIAAIEVPARQPMPGDASRRAVIIRYPYEDVFHRLERSAPPGLQAVGQQPAESSSEAEEEELDLLELVLADREELVLADREENVRESAPQPAIEPGDTILVVDDEAKVRQTICLALKELGYRVQEADCGRDAVEMLQFSRPQLVILDFLMPDMDGAEVAIEVSRIDPAIPIIFSTGHSALRALRNAAGEEIAVLPKPFTVSELGDFLSEQLAAPRRSLAA